VNGKTVVQTADAPTPAWAFSQGLRKGRLLQVSGQGPQSPATGEMLCPGDVRAQTRQVLENVRAILAAGGATMEDLIMVRVYLARRADLGGMNEAYAEFMKEHVPSGRLPCRTTLIVGLPFESMLVEIDALAVLD